MKKLKIRTSGRINLIGEHVDYIEGISISASINLYTEIEFELQDAWGFGRDIKFHKFWDRPHCACAKMDNEDNYPSGFYYFLSGCTLHG